jgi:hypothetical protein
MAETKRTRKQKAPEPGLSEPRVAANAEAVVRAAAP